jgi:hypothetical protein
MFSKNNKKMEMYCWTAGVANGEPAAVLHDGDCGTDTSYTFETLLSAIHNVVENELIFEDAESYEYKLTQMEHGLDIFRLVHGMGEQCDAAQERFRVQKQKRAGHRDAAEKTR